MQQGLNLFISLLVKYVCCAVNSVHNSTFIRFSYGFIGLLKVRTSLQRKASLDAFDVGIDASSWICLFLYVRCMFSVIDP